MFPQLPVLEKLVGELNGQVLDGTAGPVSCSVYLSDNFFGFVIVHPNGAKTKVFVCFRFHKLVVVHQ